MNTPQAKTGVEVERLHELKCWPGPFDAMARGLKTFEFRKNDRDYQVGDILRLRRFQPIDQQYTGEVMDKKVTHIMRDGFGLPDGYCVMSLDVGAAERAEAVRMRKMLETVRATLPHMGGNPMSTHNLLKDIDAALSPSQQGEPK